MFIKGGTGKVFFDTRSTAQCDGGSFKDRAPTGKVCWFEEQMAELTHSGSEGAWSDRSIDPSIFLLVCLPICLSIYLIAHLPIFKSIYLSVCLSVFLSIYLPVYLAACASFYLSKGYLPNCLPIYSRRFATATARTELGSTSVCI